MRTVYILAAVCTLIFTGCGSEMTKISIYDLRCENLTEPLGIGTIIPSLSWKIRSDKNGTQQKAYQLIVASKADLLTEQKADLWNSGKVISSSGILIAYNGKAMGSRSICYWKVRIWDEKGHQSEWSPTSSFTIGLIKRTDWNASYIGLPGEENSKVSPQLRKTFEIEEGFERIILHVNSLGYHEVYLNGRRVDNHVLTPAVCQFSKRSLTVAYDITPLVRKGRNDIIIWLGQGWYSKGLPGVVYDRPLARVQAESLKDDRWESLVKSDSTWYCRNSGYSYVGTWRSGDYGGDRVDASRLLPDLTSSSIDSVLWGPVFTAKNYKTEAYPQTTEMNSITDEIKADTVLPFGDGKWLIDMGRTLTGWAGIKFHGLKAGQELAMEYSDHLEKTDKLYDQGQHDLYIASGKKGEFFMNKFNYHGFRYITVSNLRTAPKKEDITGYLIHTNYKFASSFECSDPDLNRIHSMIFYTLRCLSLGGDLVDCPQIERLGYGGDGNASTLTAQTMFDLEPLYSNWLQAWADCIRDDGGMPHTAPNPYPAGGGPFWCGFIITASWKTYVNYGDIRILDRYYPLMQKWLGYVEKYSPDGLLGRWPDTDYRNWYLGDWAVPDGTDQTDSSSIKLVNNCFISVCYRTMQKIALLLGKDSDAAQYRAKREMIIKLIQDKLFDPSGVKYGSGSQIDLTYPLLAEVVPDSLVNPVRKNLKNEIEIKHNGHIACGLVGIPVFTEWAVKNNEADLMYSMLKKRDYPGYLYMIDKGATTTWEHWNGARSRIHNCYNGIGSWFYQAIGGIQPEEEFPGYRHFIIDPQVPADITWASTVKETPYGTVTVRWKIDEGSFKMYIEIPVSSSARVVIPANTKKYVLNGRRHKADRHNVDLGSGVYSLSWKLQR